MTESMWTDENLTECPACDRDSCFAFVEGHCTALNTTYDDCPFYREKKQNEKEIWQYFYQVVSDERFDLISQYRDTLKALGIFEKEIHRFRDEAYAIKYFRQELLCMMQADRDTDWEELIPALKDRNFDELEEQPEEDKSEDTQEDEPEEAEDSVDETEEQSESNTPDKDAAQTAEEPEEPPEPAIPDIPEDQQTADNQMNSINQLLEDSRIDAATDDDVVKDQKYRPLTVSDIYEHLIPHILPTQRSNFPPWTDLTYGTLGAEVMLRGVRNYVYTLRRQWWNPDDIDNLIEIWKYETFVGSYRYWQFTDIKPGELFDRCDEVAWNAELGEIIRDNMKEV